MTSKADIEDFLAQRTLAVVGVSRSGRKFGNIAYRDLKAKGYRLFPVHLVAEAVEGDRAYSSLEALPEKPGGVLVVVPPDQSEKVVRQAREAGINRIWLQLGADSENAIKYCQENGMHLVHNECILLYAEPISFFHKPHRWLWGLLGKLPI